jgi:hypothetical protein
MSTNNLQEPAAQVPVVAPEASSTGPIANIAATDSDASNAGVVNDSGCPDELLEAVQAIQGRGIRFVAHGSRMPSAVGENGRGAWKLLTKDEQAILRRHRDALKQLIKSGAPIVSRPPQAEPPAVAPQPTTPTPPPKRPEPEPVVYAYNRRRVTDADVLECLEDLGGRALADYRSGELSKQEAYEMTAVALRQLEELSPRPASNRLSLTSQLPTAGRRLRF